MATRISRRKLAAYVADELAQGSNVTSVLRQVAAYLVDTRRTREYELLVRDIEDALALRGIVVAEIVSAYPISEELKKNIKTLIHARTLYLREKVDRKVLGGIRIDLPGRRFDGTLLHKLDALRAKQV